jgi:hypothetical protein
MNMKPVSLFAGMKSTPLAIKGALHLPEPRPLLITYLHAISTA